MAVSVAVPFMKVRGTYPPTGVHLSTSLHDVVYKADKAVAGDVADAAEANAT